MRRHNLVPPIVVLAMGLLVSCSSDDTTSPAGRSPVMPMDRTGDHMGTMSDHMGGAHGEVSPVAHGAREIAVTADAFAFDPDEITVGAGEDVAIVLTSLDILHDFTIDELDAHVAADRGDTVAGGLRADEPGRYTFYCAVAGHRESGMEGTLVVEG